MASPRYFTIIDDNGKLGGTPGETYEMTAKQVHLDANINLHTAYRRLAHQGLRKWSDLTLSPAKASERARQAGLRKLRSVYAEAQYEKRKKLAHEERVLRGNPDLD